MQGKVSKKTYLGINQLSLWYHPEGNTDYSCVWGSFRLEDTSEYEVMKDNEGNFRKMNGPLLHARYRDNP